MTLLNLIYRTIGLLLLIGATPSYAGGGSSIGNGAPVGFTESESLKLFKILAEVGHAKTTDDHYTEYKADSISCSAPSAASSLFYCRLNFDSSPTVRLGLARAQILYAIFENYRSPASDDDKDTDYLEMRHVSCSRNDVLQSSPVCFAQ